MTAEGIDDFFVPRTPRDRLIVARGQELGLPDDPSFADLEPVVRDLLANGALLYGMGLVLGKPVYVNELKDDSGLFDIAYAALNNPDTGFKLLCNLRRQRDNDVQP